MALIPTYQPDRIKPLDFSSIKQGFSSWGDYFIKRGQEQRLKKQAIASKMSEYNAALPLFERHQEKAIEAIDQLESKYAEMLTYDKEGKLKRFFGEPQISDKEYMEWMQEAAQLGMQFDRWKKGDEMIFKETEEYKKNASKYDSRTWNMVDSDRKITGEYVRPGLEVAPANVLEYLSKLDPRTEDDIRGVTEKAMQGNEIITRIGGLSPEIQKDLYYTAARNDFAFQKGLVDKMMDDEALDDGAKIAYISGTLTDTYPTQTAQRKAYEMVRDYKFERKFDPELIEAAMYYGDHRFGLSGRIGAPQEFSVPNTTLYNDAVRRRRGEAENSQETEKPQTRTITIPGTDLKFNNAVDLSTIPDTEAQKRSLNGFIIPKGAMKVTGDGDDTTIEKKFPELNKQGDYIIDWYDTKEGFMQVRTARPKEEVDESGNILEGYNYYLIPISGNEYLLNKIKGFEPKKTEQKKGMLD